MTIGEKLLNLTTEYQQSVENRNIALGTPAGREPDVIAADYEAALKELLGA